MKSAGILTLILLSGVVCLAQQDNASISGQVVEESTGNPLQYVQVMLAQPSNGTILTGTLTDEFGRFSLSGVETGNYEIQISYIGYEITEFPVFIGGLNTFYDIGTIELAESALEGETVIVEGQREVVSSELDRMSFSIDDFFTQSSGSVLEAMRGLPGVTVDQEGKILLRGSDKVAVYVDGKQFSLTGGNQNALDNIPVTNVDHIEIINNPSARYDASGMAGIINIVSETQVQMGLNGEVGFAFGLSGVTTRKEDLPTELGRYTPNEKYIPSLNMNYRSSHVNWFWQSEIHRQHSLPNNEFTTRTYQDGTRFISQVPENRTQTHYFISGGLDWYPDDQNLLNFTSVIDYESHIDTAQVPYINMNTMERNRFWHWSEDEVTGYTDFQLNYEHQFPQIGHELSATAQYTRGWEDEAYYLNDSSAIRQSIDNTHIVATEHITNLIFDYIKPLRSGRIEAGTKIQFRTLPVTYTTEQGINSIIYPNLGEWSEWGENIFAGYLNTVYERPNFSVEAGLRAEQTFVFYDIDPVNIYYSQNDKYDYFEMYPNVRFTYRINTRNNLSAFYNRRVDRPGEPELRIFPKYDDPELLKVGNPYLRPQFTRAIELAYERNWETGSVFIAAYTRKIQDPFTRVYSVDDSNDQYDIVNKIYHNVGSADNTGIEILLSQSLAPFWRLTSSLNLYRNLIHNYEGTLLFPYQRSFSIQQTTDQTWDLKLTNIFNLPGSLQIQVGYIYYAPKNIPQGKQYARSSVDLSMRKGIFQGRGEMVFSVNDIFNNFGIKQRYCEDNFNVLYENYYDTQIAQLGVNFKF